MAEDLVSQNDDEDELFDLEDSKIVRAKWAMDDATTLSEAAAKVEAFAAYLRDLESEGWQLIGPVEDDYGFIKQKPRLRALLQP